MKKLCILLILFSGCLGSYGQVMLGSANWKFKTGDSGAWMNSDFDDQSWETVKVGVEWEKQGHPGYDGIAWYRAHFSLPSSLKSRSFLKDSIHVIIGEVDDEDECFLNGKLIGSNGSNTGIPTTASGPLYEVLRNYTLSVNDPTIHWDGDNVLAVRVHDTGGEGGMRTGPFLVRMDEIKDHLIWSTDSGSFQFKENGMVEKRVKLINTESTAVKGTLDFIVSEGRSSKTMESRTIAIPAKSSFYYLLRVQATENTQVKLNFKETISSAPVSKEFYVPYILTPASPDAPQINGARITGARPGHPFLFTIPATGERPMHFMANGLPAGLKLDKESGIISGACPKAGRYVVALQAKNNAGNASSSLVIVIGTKIGLTPAMGWNSWNAFGLSVNTDHVKDAVNAMIGKGLINHGFTYVNLDDGWEQEKRDADGYIHSNEKFPDMNELTDFIHAHGLKAGLYSSPGPKTCGGFTASWQHEAQDVQTWTKWGFDYIKYDWCSYQEIDTTHNKTRENFMRPYRVLQKELAKSNRDIYYSLCQYGMGDVWKWGAQVSGNSWRTTGDITDTWNSLSSIGFSQNISSAYSKPGGGWNDPDMLVIGNVGWGPSLHPTRLSPNEQYTHISQWCLLSSPLLIGCDMADLDAFTLNLISNDEVLAIDQDALGKQATKAISNPEYQVWIKHLESGKTAIGIFNLSKSSKKISLNWALLKIAAGKKVRDVWRQKETGTTSTAYSADIPSHGVRLLRID